MDPEKFDKVVLDLLYDELDELTRASALRHVEQSSSARRLYAGLRATREVGSLPLVDPPDDLEERILSAERTARAERPLKQRLGSVVSILAGYAMRPQLAMAALLLLMIGGSLILLRPRPGDHDIIQVTERGTPEAERESITIVPVPEPSEADKPGQAHGVLRSWSEADEEAHAGPEGPRLARTETGEAPAAPLPADRSPAAGKGFAGSIGEVAARARSNGKKTEATMDEAEPTAGPFGEALQAFEESRFVEAREQFDEIARTATGPKAANAALYAARAALQASGCAVAVTRFEQVAERHPGTAYASDGSWQAAECHRQLGQLGRARSVLTGLAEDPAYAERARVALAALDTKEAERLATGPEPRRAAKPAAAKPAAPAPSSSASGSP